MIVTMSGFLSGLFPSAVFLVSTNMLVEESHEPDPAPIHQVMDSQDKKERPSLGSLSSVQPEKVDLRLEKLGRNTNRAVQQNIKYLQVRFVLEPKSSPVLSTEISGTVVSLPVREGQTFRKGSPLLKLGCTIERSRYNAAKIEETGQQKIYLTNSELARSNSISALEVAKASFEYEKAKAQVRKERAILEKCTIYAPFNGLLTVRNVSKNEYVKEGTPAIEVIDNSSFVLSMLVPSDWLGWMKVGTVFTARFDETGKTYKARIKKIGVKVDSVSRTVSVKGALTEKADELIYGLSGQASFTQ